jgi:hypothetical protein
MFIVIRKGEELSLKTNYVVQLINQRFRNRVFLVFKNEKERFTERWSPNQANLSSSTFGLILYYLLIMLKSPRNSRNDLMARLSLRKRRQILTEEGFLSTLSRTLYLHYGTSARDGRLMNQLENLKTPKIFIVDEFISLNCLDLKKLHALGPVIYVSQDIASNRFCFSDSIITKSLTLKLERAAIPNIDLVVACSERERTQYLEMGARNAIFYPNLYPTAEFEPGPKDDTASLSIVLRGHWGSRAEKSLEQVFNMLAFLNKQITVYMLGMMPKRVPNNVKLEHVEFVKDKLEYLRILSKSWIGVNIGIHMAGTNERKYDYAEAGTVVCSDTLGSRGDLLPYEYTYIDTHDMAAKMRQLLDFGKERLSQMGKENRKHSLHLAEKQQRILAANIEELASNAARTTVCV